MDDDPSALELAEAVAIYLTEELDRNSDVFIPVHRDVAVCALGIISAAIDELANEARKPH
ncbi:hypothetical protein WBP07_08800 [Novosphingobium sp. BL-8A]|uniref:hypothetical protein n=1 Tax=Novosphingobium sp. BL-8A TaxID=3127639 RepID=UPI003758113D